MSEEGRSLSEFEAFQKIPRLKRKIIVTEKIDGTNAQVCVDIDGTVRAGSRKRWVTEDQDNFGFGAWVKRHEDELREHLGVGRHFGEWWGAGIQRRYGLGEKRFSLFNVQRWNHNTIVPGLFGAVPVLYEGPNDPGCVEDCLERLRIGGSVAAPGFMDPEGVVVYYTKSRDLFKITLDGDGHKGEAA